MSLRTALPGNERNPDHVSRLKTRVFPPSSSAGSWCFLQNLVIIPFKREVLRLNHMCTEQLQDHTESIIRLIGTVCVMDWLLSHNQWVVYEEDGPPDFLSAPNLFWSIMMQGQPKASHHVNVHFVSEQNKHSRLGNFTNQVNTRDEVLFLPLKFWFSCL